MQLEITLLNEVGQTWRDKYLTFSYVQNLDLKLYVCVYMGVSRNYKRGHERGRNDLKEDENLDNEIHAGGDTNWRGKKRIISGEGHGRGQWE